MRKISAILTVYNEEQLLPILLKNIEEHVDEIVVVDGSANGESTDATAEIAKGNSKVIYKSGIFRAANGSWDCGMQKNAAITAADGDIFVILSADMVFYNLDRLIAAIRKFSEHKLFFASTIEFWLDTEHIRLYSANEDAKTVSGGILQAVAVDSSIKPYFDDNGNLAISDVSIEDRVLVPDCIKYHMGWIRDFQKQVDKHMMHVRQLRWGEHGDKLLAEGDRAVEQWAIIHTLSYPQIPSVCYGGELPSVIAEAARMKYNDGYKDVLGVFESKHGFSAFKARQSW